MTVVGTGACRNGGRLNSASLLYLARSPIDGQGVFARCDIPAGRGVIECRGVLLDRSEVTDNMRAMQVGPNTYLAEEPGNPGLDDFLNHSCDPNVAFLDGSLILYARRDIPASDEIVFDYSTCMNERGWWLACRCGSSRCRGRVLSFCDLPSAARRRLSPMTLAYLRRCRRRRRNSRTQRRG